MGHPSACWVFATGAGISPQLARRKQDAARFRVPHPLLGHDRRDACVRQLLRWFAVGGAVGGTAPEEALATGRGGGSPAATGPAARPPSVRREKGLFQRVQLL
jgi:hypothetical protein